MVLEAVLRHRQHWHTSSRYMTRRRASKISRRRFRRGCSMCAFLLSTLVGDLFFLPWSLDLLRSLKILAGIGRSTWLMRPASGLQVLCAGQFAVFISKAMNQELFIFDGLLLQSTSNCRIELAESENVGQPHRQSKQQKLNWPS